MNIATDIIKKIFYGIDCNNDSKDLRIVSLLFGVCIVTGGIYYYNSNTVSLIIFFLFTFFIQAGAYFIFDFISKRKLIGSVIYVFAFVFIIFLANILITLQQSIGVEGLDVDISFMFWFLTPQSAMPYFPFYTYAILLISSFFISSAVYYFTMVIYRATMTFLLMLIPLAIYAKELQHIPLILIICLFILYFSIMSLNTPRRNLRSVKIFKSFKYYKAISYFLISSVLIITLIPKPTIVANRDYIESIINANELTSKFMNTLNQLNNKSDGGLFFNFQNSNKILFYVESDEMINLKARVLENYDYSDDSWSIDERYIYKYFNYYSDNLNPNDFINIIEKVCKDNQAIVNKYNLNDFLNADEVDDCKKNINIIANNFSTEYLLVPTGLSQIPDIPIDDLVATTGGEVGISGRKQFNPDIKYDIEYHSESIVNSQKVIKLITQFNNENYLDFLNDLEKLIQTHFGYSNYAFSNAQYYTYKQAMQYYEKTYQEPSERILKLAHEITENKFSDYEKAKAIEEYFLTNNFTYDLNYKKDVGDNVENFLFESKTGVCYEFATAMVLLARAAGLPARYVEGFSVSNYSNKYGCYTITAKESHAFPEVYISGYGWMSFEPTVPSNETDVALSAKKDFMFFMQITMFMILIITIILCMIFVPKIIEWTFRIKLKKYSYGDRVVRIFKRLKAIFKFNECITSKEMSDYFLNKYGIDFLTSEIIFDKYVYGNKDITKQEFKKVYQQYITLLTDERKYVKTQKRLKVKSILKLKD